MRMVGKQAAMAAFLALGGCQSPVRLQAIDVSAISAVQTDLKRQFSIYGAAAHEPVTILVAHGNQLVRTPVGALPAMADGGSPFACGNGQIAFEIVSVLAELTTTLDRSLTASLDATVPVDLITLKGGIHHQRDVSNIQTLRYNLFPVPLDTAGIRHNSDDIAAAPIAQVLLDLREALVSAALRLDYGQDPPIERPRVSCVRDYDLADPAGSKNTYAVALSITNVTGTKINIDVGVIAPGMESERKSINGNTLTVTFRQTLQDQTSRIAAVRHNQPTRFTAACAPPREKSIECQRLLSDPRGVALQLRIPPV